MNAYQSAIHQLQDLLTTAVRSGITDAQAAALATVDSRGAPSVRMVYIALVDEQGLVFHVHSQSGKARQLRANDRAGLCFYWREPVKAQVNITGCVESLSEADADRCWARRSRDSRLAAWASDPLRSFESWSALRRNLRRVRQKSDFSSLPRPAGWVGFRLIPDHMNFWSSGWKQLRPRVRFDREDDGSWSRQVVNP